MFRHCGADLLLTKRQKKAKALPLIGTTFEVAPEPWRLSDSRKLRMTLRKLGKSLADARWVAVRVVDSALQLLTAWDTKENWGFLSHTK